MLDSSNGNSGFQNNVLFNVSVQWKIYKYYKQWILFCCMLNMLRCYKNLKQNIWNLHANNQQFLYFHFHTCLLSVIMQFNFLCNYLPTHSNLLQGLVWMPWILVPWTCWEAKMQLHENDLLTSSHYNHLNTFPMQCAIKIVMQQWQQSCQSPVLCPRQQQQKSTTGL